MKSLSKVLKYIIPYKTYALLSVISNLLSVLFHLLSLLVLIPFLKLLFVGGEMAAQEPEFSWTADYVSEMLKYKMQPYIEQYGQEGGLYFLCIAVAVLFFGKNRFR